MIFGILGPFGIEIGDPIFLSKIFSSKKKSEHFWSKIFWDQKISIFVRKKIVEKVNENSKFRNFENFSKFQNFEFSLTFSSKFFSGKNRKCLVPIFFSTKSFRIFFDDFFSTKKIGSHISIPNDPKIPKITLRTACDHYKITNSEHEKKVRFFSPILPSWGVPISWILCIIMPVCLL